MLVKLFVTTTDSGDIEIYVPDPYNVASYDAVPSTQRAMYVVEIDFYDGMSYEQISQYVMSAARDYIARTRVEQR